MHHTTTTPRPQSDNPHDARIADLSEEYLSARPDRREEIGELIAGLMNGTIAPIR